MVPEHYTPYDTSHCTNKMFWHSGRMVREHDVLYNTSPLAIPTILVHSRQSLNMMFSMIHPTKQKMFYYNAKKVTEHGALYSTPLHIHILLAAQCRDGH